MVGMTKTEIQTRIANSLVEFGYPETTPGMVSDCWAAFEAGNSMPHDIIGMFVERQLYEIQDSNPAIITRGSAGKPEA